MHYKFYSTVRYCIALLLLLLLLNIIIKTYCDDTDLLWCYKIVFGVVDLMCDDFFKLCPCTVIRGHVYKLYKPSSTTSARSRFFACRIINAWNNLPLSTDFSSVNAFKRSISKTDFSEFLKYYFITFLDFILFLLMV